MFPLHTVLFPGGLLALRVFEARYLDMVADCLKTRRGFGAVLIREGNEVGTAAVPYEVGTLAKIVDWDARPGGLLEVRVLGAQRLRILSCHVLDNHLSEGCVHLLPPEAPEPLPQNYVPLRELLRSFLERLGPPYTEVPPAYDDAGWVGSRLAELLPIDLRDKQRLLLEQPLERLAILSSWLAEV
jgi:Lon protease-like protein